MFELHTTVERPDGTSESALHGEYRTRREAEQIGENLRLLYSWVKSFEVRGDASAETDKPDKKMTGSVRKSPARRKKSS